MSEIYDLFKQINENSYSDYEENAQLKIPSAENTITILSEEALTVKNTPRNEQIIVNKDDLGKVRIYYFGSKAYIEDTLNSIHTRADDFGSKVLLGFKDALKEANKRLPDLETVIMHVMVTDHSRIHEFKNALKKIIRFYDSERCLSFFSNFEKYTLGGARQR